MKQIATLLLSLILLSSCSSTVENQQEEIEKDGSDDSKEANDRVKENDSSNGELSSDQNKDENDIPPNGKYIFDLAFAEYQGQSMGEKVAVIINGNSIKVIYEGGGNLTSVKKGEIFDEGEIMKHKSGKWIIGSKKTDVDLDEIGGCTGGPALIDFKNKKYWTC